MSINNYLYILNLRTKFGLEELENAEESKFIMLNSGSQVIALYCG